YFVNLVVVVVVRREQHLDMLLPHLVDHLEHVAWRWGDPWLGLDVVDAGEAVLVREVVPFFVVARDGLAAEGPRLLQPPARPAYERRALELLGLEEVEQLPLPVEIRERRPAD